MTKSGDYHSKPLVESSVNCSYDLSRYFLESCCLDFAGWSKRLNFDIAISKELDFVIGAWAYHCDHDGVTNALQVKLDFGISQFAEKFEQLS